MTAGGASEMGWKGHWRRGDASTAPGALWPIGFVNLGFVNLGFVNPAAEKMELLSTGRSPSHINHPWPWCQRQQSSTTEVPQMPDHYRDTLP